MNYRAHSGVRAEGPHNPRARQSVTGLLRAATSDPARPLDAQVRRPLEQRLNHDLGYIRIHSGRASEAAASRLGARAYALGRDIHLGAESHALTAERRQRLLAHEAVHTVQQGGASISPHEDLSVSRPSDAAEFEAAQIADALPGSQRFVPKESMIGRTGINAVTRVTPQIQRDLTGRKTTRNGDFDLDMRVESHPGDQSGLYGTIKFRPSENAPNAWKIRLLQIARVEDLSLKTSKEITWTGDEANRMNVMTKADKAAGVEEGYFVDVHHGNRTPRTAKRNRAVSPYYGKDFALSAEPHIKDGRKIGKLIKEASLLDFPGANSKSRFSFETAAKASGSGYIYATLKWGFTVSDPVEGIVDNEHASASVSQSPTFGAAVKAFDDFYRNPGTAKAPK